MRRKYTEETKQAVLNDVATGSTITDAAKKHKVSLPSAAKWVSTMRPKVINFKPKSKSEMKRLAAQNDKEVFSQIEDQNKWEIGCVEVKPEEYIAMMRELQQQNDYLRLLLKTFL